MWRTVVLLFTQLQAHLINSLTCHVNSQNVQCFPKVYVCPGDLVTLTYNGNVDAESVLWMFPNGTCSLATIPDAIVVDEGPPATCNGQNGSCGPFTAANFNGGVVGPCLVSTLTVRIVSSVQSRVHIQVGTRTTFGIGNITNSTDLIVTEAPGSPNISVSSGLTNLTIHSTPSSFGGSPEYYNATLMNGTTVLYDQVVNETVCFSQLSSNMMYYVKVAAINCASVNVTTLPAFTLPYPPLNIKAVKQEINGSGINLTLSWIHIGGTVFSYQISLKCCDSVKPLVANVSVYCKDMLCSYSQFITVINLTYVTISSVNPGGVGPESEPIKVDQSEGRSSNLVPKVTVPLIIIIALLCAVAAVCCWCCRLIPAETIRIQVKAGWQSEELQTHNGDITITINSPGSVIYNCGGEQLKTNKERRYLVYAKRLYTYVYAYSSTCTTYPVTEGQELNYIIHRLRCIMNLDTVQVEVRRNWNPLLYYKYISMRKSFQKRNTPLNERIMFRGTKPTSTEFITNNDKGYGNPADSDFGEGVYFSEEASYAAMYAYDNKTTGKKELTLALIITGDTTDTSLDTENPNTKRPYDSCMKRKTCSTDFTKEGFCCAIKNIEQSYPLYTITYMYTAGSASGTK